MIAYRGSLSARRVRAGWGASWWGSRSWPRGTSRATWCSSRAISATLSTSSPRARSEHDLGVRQGSQLCGSSQEGWVGGHRLTQRETQPNKTSRLTQGTFECGLTSTRFRAISTDLGRSRPNLLGCLRPHLAGSGQICAAFRKVALCLTNLGQFRPNWAGFGQIGPVSSKFGLLVKLGLLGPGQMCADLRKGSLGSATLGRLRPNLGRLRSNLGEVGPIVAGFDHI